MTFLREFFYALLYGFFAQNLTFELGVGTGNLFKLSNEKGPRRRWFFLVMLAVSLTATPLTFLLDEYLLSRLTTDEFLRTCFCGFSFTVVIALLALLAELLFTRLAPNVRKSLGSYLPSACMNSAVLAILFLNRQAENDLLQAELFALMAVLGFILSVLLVQLLRERVVLVRCPPTMKGEPLALLATAILSLAFAGLTGLTLG